MKNLDRLKELYPDFLVSLDCVKPFMRWFEQCEHPTAWDMERYEFCQTVVKLGCFV